MSPKETKGQEKEEGEKNEDTKAEKHKKKHGPLVPKKWYYTLYQVAYLALSIVAIILSLVIIGYGLFSAVELLKITTDRAGLIVSLFVIIVCAALTVSVLTYTSVYVYKRNLRTAVFASFLLLIPFVVQACLVGTVVSSTVHDDEELFRSLANLFTLSRGFQTKYAKQFHNLEYSLKCCGLFNPNDYRLVYFDRYHPPDVPITCCPSYNPLKSEDQQEDARQLCLKERTYYKEGCKVPAVQIIEHGLGTLQKLNWPVLALDIILMALGLVALIFVKWPRKETEEQHKKDKPEEP